jgi:predicted CXXCH cytochrome family protein
MDVLVRNVRQGPNGVADFLDTAVAVDVVSIGSAADSTVQLLGRAVGTTHAVIEAAGSGFGITCRRGHRIRVNGIPCASKNIAVGDTIELGGHQLLLIQPPAGFDLAIEIHTNSQVGASDFEAAFRTDLDRTWLSKRAAAWTLSVLTLLFTLAIPYSTIWLHRGGLPTPLGLPDDAAWSSGPLSRAHAHATGSQCAACHQRLFAHVQDKACRECHKTTLDHVTEKQRALTRLGPAQRCGACHGEHNGAAGRLIADDDQLCVACHADSDKAFGSLRVHQVSGFAPHEHPAFAVSLQKLSGSTADGAANLQWSRYRTPLAGAVEQSNLKFSHTQHLDGKKVTSITTGAALGCGGCHIPTADGDHFLPITMAASCSPCHQLNFDISAPDRQLPHGKPLDAILMIEDYFARKFTDPAPTPAVMPVRRLPDLERDPSRNSQIDVCTGSAVACARQRARAEVENQFTGRGCISCHVVVDSHSADQHERFRVTPVRLGSEYFSELRFDHKIHRVQGTLTGDAACESCHSARKSTLATKLLLPEVDGCLRCHRDRNASRTTAAQVPAGAGHEERAGDADKVITLSCIGCHVYHPTSVLDPVSRTE